MCRMRRYFAVCLLIVFSGCLPARSTRPLPPEAAPASEKFHVPLKGRVSLLSPYGKRGRRYHTGIDIRARRGGGDPVLASRAGKVVYVGRLSGYGNLISIQHADGFYSRYAHMSRVRVKKNQRVAAGQDIGTVGRTGRASTEHLHFEILTPRSRFVDPYPLVFGRSRSTS